MARQFVDKEAAKKFLKEFDWFIANQLKADNGVALAPDYVFPGKLVADPDNSTLQRSQPIAGQDLNDIVEAAKIMGWNEHYMQKRGDQPYWQRDRVATELGKRPRSQRIDGQAGQATLSAGTNPFGEAQGFTLQGGDRAHQGMLDPQFTQLIRAN